MFNNKREVLAGGAPSTILCQTEDGWRQAVAKESLAKQKGFQK